jgi:anthranilate synthase/aminodeoxychorismate synthase-like glutamine amidotransferase
VLVVDNYDSFVYNLVQYLAQLGSEPIVRRNDAVAADEVRHLRPDGVLISPGPGRPEDAGISVALVRDLAGSVPLLGVCLGHQAIAFAFGGKVGRAPELLHGKTTEVSHDGRGIFSALRNPFVATRYHSLAVEREGLPADLEVSAWAPDGTIMGLRHRRYAVDGVQFHPESVLTEGGYLLLANWLALCGLPSALEQARSLPSRLAPTGGVGG